MYDIKKYNEVIETSSPPPLRWADSCTHQPSFKLSRVDPINLLSKMTERFATVKKEKGEKDFSKYIKDVYGTKNTQERLLGAVERVRDALRNGQSPPYLKTWKQALAMFSKDRETDISKICEKSRGQTVEISSCWI